MSLLMFIRLHCRYKGLQLSSIQIAGAGMSLVAAIAFYIAIELWRYKSDMMHFPH